MFASLIMGGIFALIFGKFSSGYQRAMMPLRPEETEDLPRWMVRLDYIGYFLHSVIPSFCLAMAVAVGLLISLDNWLHGVAG
jgi:hypothetical protein